MKTLQRSLQAHYLGASAPDSCPLDCFARRSLTRHVLKPETTKRNERNDRNETSETKQNHRNKQNPLPLLRANRKQANLSDIQANRSAIQANRSVPCTQVSLNTTPVSLNITQVSLNITQDSLKNAQVSLFTVRFVSVVSFRCFGF